VSSARRVEQRAAEVLDQLRSNGAVDVDATRIDRRRFLVAGGSALSAAILSACNSYGPRRAEPLLRFMERRNEAVERALFRSSSHDRPARRARDAGSAYPVYYIADTLPRWDEATRGPWMLDIGGLVSYPMRFALTDLMQLSRVNQRVDHFCVEGWNAVATWTGVRLRDIAGLVKPLPDAQYVDFQSFDDDYHESWDLESALHPQTLIAYGMEGAMLGAAHGGPARVHSPIKLGYKNTKYLTKIVFLAARNGGYWSDQGYEWYGGT
jgi:DMSO/TMAO reductase YedYZ molybdopterin-dependent catalytic subunit